MEDILHQNAQRESAELGLIDLQQGTVVEDKTEETL